MKKDLLVLMIFSVALVYLLGTVFGDYKQASQGIKDYSCSVYKACK